MSDTYGAVVIYEGESKSALFECDICECKFKVRINADNQDDFRRTPLLRLDRTALKTPNGIEYERVKFRSKCPCCGSEVETNRTMTEDDEDV
ncbi:hypothetical protein EOM86_14925 [Candidatus Nomurabacteria bacterium]|nr:hypothetical protein [Candidatus Nomurabacteria bacterium]